MGSSFVGAIFGPNFRERLSGLHDTFLGTATLCGRVFESTDGAVSTTKDDLELGSFGVDFHLVFLWSRGTRMIGAQFSVAAIWIQPDLVESAENPRESVRRRLLNLGADW